jgi:hypothetical protein
MCKEFPRVTRIYPHSTAAVVSCTRSSTELQESTHILQQLLYHVQGVPLSYKNLPHSTAAVVSCTRSSPELQESIHILQQLFYHIREVQSATRIYPHSTAAVLSHTRSSLCYKSLPTFFKSLNLTFKEVTYTNVPYTCSTNALLILYIRGDKHQLTCHTPTTALQIKIVNITKGSTNAVTCSSLSSNQANT